MIEATRRRSPAPTGSAMRRLMTRPIHAQLGAAAQPRPAVTEAAVDASDEAVDDLARLRLEVMMMKAALAAERRESEALRASLGLAESETLGEEARAVRERWAALVERLIHDSL